MRILFVAPGLPVPTSGGRTRLQNLVKCLAARHEVTILSFVQPSEHALVGQARECCQRLELVPFDGHVPLRGWSNRLRGWVRILFDPRPQYARTFPVDTMREPLRRLLAAQTFDVVIFEHLSMVELTDEVGGVPAILAEHNVESGIARQAFLSAGNPIHRLRDWLTWRKLQAFERRWLQRFSVAVAVSEADASELRAMSPATRIHVVPNGVDCRAFAPAVAARDADTLLFFGTLSYAPNLEGIAWFCRQVLPRIREARPAAELYIAGLNLPPLLSALGELPGVSLAGFVPDIRSLLWQATVCVVPLRMGGGTRLKILEALAAGLPVVSTAAGANGLDVVHGQHLLIADGPEVFAKSVLELLESASLRQRLAEAGQRLTAEHYDWRTIACQFETACLQAAQLADASRGGPQAGGPPFPCT